VQKAVTLQGSFSHNWPIWERVINLLSSGRLDLDPILNRVAPLTDWEDAFDAMHTGEIVKAVLVPAA
jgi:alcohol dehydrogenase/L-iditol 2-dehydrogenase